MTNTENFIKHVVEECGFEPDISYKPKYQVISKLIYLLYDLDDCGAGGCCHFVTDDDNLYDDDLKFVIEYCQRKENANCIDKEISTLICTLLLDLSFAQRVILFEVHMMYGCVDESTWKYYLEHNFSEEIFREYDFRNEFIKD